MSDTTSYSEKKGQRNVIKLRKILEDLPPFCKEYFRGTETTTSILTRVNYAYDLRLFFEFLTKEVQEFKDRVPQQLTIEDLKNVEAVHLEMFLEHMNSFHIF